MNWLEHKEDEMVVTYIRPPLYNGRVIIRQKFHELFSVDKVYTVNALYNFSKEKGYGMQLILSQDGAGTVIEIHEMMLLDAKKKPVLVVKPFNKLTNTQKRRIEND